MVQEWERALLERTLTDWILMGGVEQMALRMSADVSRRDVSLAGKRCACARALLSAPCRAGRSKSRQATRQG